MRISGNKIEKGFIYLIYVCGYGLLLERLYYPLKEVTDISYMSIFMIYGAFCYLLTMTPMKWLLSALLKVLGIVLIVDKIFIKDPFLSSEWWRYVYDQITHNWNPLLHTSWHQLTNEYRTILFMVIIWMMSFIIYYLLVYVKRPFAFVALTFMYVGVFDAFTTYDGTYAVIRMFIVGLLVIGATHYLAVNQKEAEQTPSAKHGMIWLISIVTILLFSV